MRFFAFASFALAVSALSLSDLRADDWPQFRGINGSGVSPATDPLPTEFFSGDKLLWKAELGDGIGSVVIVAPPPTRGDAR